jgi:hypothetical protein
MAAKRRTLGRHALVICLLDFLISIAIIINFNKCFRPRRRRGHPQPSPLIAPLAPRRYPHVANDSFTADKLSDAVANLPLPTWSRGHVGCAHPKSEVTCSEVVRAWRTVRGWVELMAATPLEERR